MSDELTPATIDASLKRARGDTPPPPDALDAIDIDLVSVEALFVDDRYQRKVSQASASRMRKIAREFTWSRFGALIVAGSPEGGYAVIDGQHRMLVARAIGITEVPAVVLKSALVEQALDFVGINTTRTSVASIDKFRARVTAGDKTAETVADILSDLEVSYDIAAGYPLGVRQTRAVSLLEKLVKTLGRGEVFTALQMIIESQPETPGLLTAFTIEATALTLNRVISGEGDIDRLMKVLEETDFEDLKDRAATICKQRGSGKQSHEGHALLLATYNKGLHKRIS